MLSAVAFVGSEREGELLQATQASTRTRVQRIQLDRTILFFNRTAFIMIDRSCSIALSPAHTHGVIINDLSFVHGSTKPRNTAATVSPPEKTGEKNGVSSANCLEIRAYANDNSPLRIVTQIIWERTSSLSVSTMGRSRAGKSCDELHGGVAAQPYRVGVRNKTVETLESSQVGYLAFAGRRLHFLVGLAPVPTGLFFF